LAIKKKLTESVSTDLLRCRQNVKSCQRGFKQQINLHY